jgi:hypothetical protein
MTVQKVYLDKNRNIVKPDKAIWLVVHTYNDKGELEKEEWFNQIEHPTDNKSSEGSASSS